jgi:hypothetical protein
LIKKGEEGEKETVCFGCKVMALYLCDRFPGILLMRQEPMAGFSGHSNESRIP